MDIPFGSEANLIKVELHISDVLKINDRDFSITFSLYFNVQWLEPRLNLNPSFFQNRSVGWFLGGSFSTAYWVRNYYLLWVA